MANSLPSIPAKRYFTIGEVSELCSVKPYVLRYWEQEFTQLKPMKRRGNRRYYQRHEVELIRRIRELLYDEGFTISGARNRLADFADMAHAGDGVDDDEVDELPDDIELLLATKPAAVPVGSAAAAVADRRDHMEVLPSLNRVDAQSLRAELLSIRELLSV
jgi:DNA-binding transcriptional MerR regulator